MPETLEPSEPQHPRVKRGFVRTHFKWFTGIYLFLLLASNIADWQMDEARIVWGNMFLDKHNAPTFEVDTTGLPVNINPLPYRVVIEGDLESTFPPVLLLHGSPGAAYGFEGFAPKLSENGRRVIYLDLPGFASQNEPWSRGSVFEDYSARTYAQIMWRLLEAMGDEQRVHIVGWSNSGAVGLRMIEQHPDRVATLTMLAAVGAQENEGTGSYAFEHFKYRVGRLVLDHGSHLYPHFGLLGPMGERNAFLRFFDDTDQRDLGALMESIDTPTMIMHGRHDFLIADRAAEDHYQRMKSARLVMLDAMHFIPMMDAESTLAASYLNPFFNRHDVAGVEPETDYVDLAPVPDRAGADAFVRVVGLWIRSMPWWSVLIASTILIRVRPYVGIAIVTVFVSIMDIDFGIALLAMFVGRAWWLVRGADRLDRPWTILGWVRGFLYVLPAFVIGSIGATITLRLAEVGDWIGLLLGFWITWAALRLVRLVVTREGWQRIRGRFQRLTNHEYYPSGVLYLTTLIAAFARIASGKGLRPLTAVNPGYSRDGGLKEERKSQLDARFTDDPSVLRCVLIGPDRDARRRGAYADECISTNPALGGYPIIAKPDQGARGEGVRIIRNHDELTRYCGDRREPFVLQRFHPGPIEVGILWIRHAETIAEPESPAGFIYAINKKDFPEIVGDGKRSLRRLILRHPRHRAQARMFIERLREQQHLIPGDGERVSLGSFGNHAQGAMFTDGAELITPELSARIDSIADGFRDDQGRGFDIGRFDVRCSSYEALMRGEELGIVELNGLTSEPTNIYDPTRSLGWAWSTLLGYWRHVEALADARIADGSGEPISKKEAWDMLNDFLRAMSR
ncbi:MAG: alpha/beta fold hydrolase [Phycisphaerales bacterium]